MEDKQQQLKAMAEEMTDRNRELAKARQDADSLRRQLAGAHQKVEQISGRLDQPQLKSKTGGNQGYLVYGGKNAEGLIADMNDRIRSLEDKLNQADAANAALQQKYDEVSAELGEAQDNLQACAVKLGVFGDTRPYVKKVVLRALAP